ncbi:hypothetical protein MtrunA17_Chr2g0277371 [Medicago truncatula]|uniref:Uncharacterized protein n=1 Tax=Medicago truncatula TaxID=3880 RepID=A0A396J4R7_MEDTR|nr:hypothetical protein MtrunA17_Chr2g0277371 [Medicago truncatula]
MFCVCVSEFEVAAPPLTGTIQIVLPLPAVAHMAVAGNIFDGRRSPEKELPIEEDEEAPPPPPSPSPISSCC